MLQRLYDILFELKEYVLLAGLVALSLILLALNDTPQVKRIRAVTSVVFGVAQEQVSFIPTYFGLRDENALLRRLNVELSDEAYRLREARLENIRLRELLALRDRSHLTLSASRVISKNLTLLRNTLTIDRGRSDGIADRMPVVSENGLVGMVLATSAHYSIVNIMLNTDFRASAKIQRSRVDGILAWDGVDLQLKNVPKTRDVKSGDVVITSGYSTVFPEGIRIGVVNTVGEQAGSMFKTITVLPGTDFVRLEEVFVVRAVPDSERVALEISAGVGR